MQLWSIRKRLGSVLLAANDTVQQLHEWPLAALVAQRRASCIAINGNCHCAMQRVVVGDENNLIAWLHARMHINARVSVLPLSHQVRTFLCVCLFCFGPQTHIFRPKRASSITVSLFNLIAIELSHPFRGLHTPWLPNHCLSLYCPFIYKREETCSVCASGLHHIRM